MDMRTNFQRAMTRKGYEGAIAIFILFLFIGNNLYADNSNYLEYMQAPPEAQTSVSAQPTVPTAPSPEASNELPTTTASLMGGGLWRCQLQHPLQKIQPMRLLRQHCCQAHRIKTHQLQ